MRGPTGVELAGTLESGQDAATDRERIVECLQAGRMRGPVVVSEIGVRRTGGEQQDIEIE